MKNKPYTLNVAPQINNLKDIIAYCANTYKNKIAFQFENKRKIEQKNYQELLDDINGLGTALHNLGLHNKKIALIGINSYQWILSYFAVINGGNIIVPLDPEIIEIDLANLIKKTNVSCIICSKKCAEKVQKINNHLKIKNILVLETDILGLVTQGKELICKGIYSFIDYQVQDDVCSAILYTSGTTSEPKGVMISHKNIASNVVASIKNVYFKGTSILVLPLHHAFALTASVLCVMLSGRTILINRNLKELKNDLIKFKPQNLILVPMIVESLYKQIWIIAKKRKKDILLNKLIILSNLLLKFGIDLRKIFFFSVRKSFGGKLDFIISGGAPLQNKYVEGFRALGIQILNGYGITECSPVLSVNRNYYFRDHSVGQVLDGIDIKIIDNEILVKGDVVSSGYFQNDEQTAQVFQDGWFKTGDLGYVDEDSFLYITGRKKNLIVLSNGKNISPEEIEEYFYKLDYIKEVMVYQTGDQIVAEVYFGNENIDEYSKQLKKDLNMINSQLQTYKNISKTIVRKIEFPKTITKKIKRI